MTQRLVDATAGIEQVNALQADVGEMRQRVEEANRAVREQVGGVPAARRMAGALEDLNATLAAVARLNPFWPPREADDRSGRCSAARRRPTTASQVGSSVRAARASSTRPTGVVRGAGPGTPSASAAMRDQGVGQGGHRLRALGLGRLDHERLVDDQREVDGRRVEALLQQALADVEGPHARWPS